MQLRITQNGLGGIVQDASPVFTNAYDAIVVGVGTAGAEALATLAQYGMHALGIEKSNGPGGQGTVGGVSFDCHIPTLLQQLEQRCLATDIHYESVAIGAWTDNGRIVGLRIITNGIMEDVKAKTVIDATGNATIAKMLGLPLRQGRDFDHTTAPCSRVGTGINLKSGVIRPNYQMNPEELMGSAEDYTESLFRCTRERYHAWLKYKSGERLLKPAAILGAREECRVTTEYIVTLQETLEEKEFKDPIFYTWDPHDLIHFYSEHAFESEPTQNWKVLCGLPLFAYPAVLPYGTIVAKGIDGLLVPSKHFGVSHDLGGGVRMEPEMRKTGVAAACAAIAAIRGGHSLKSLPYNELKPFLEETGNLEPPEFSYVTSVRGVHLTPISLEDAIDALKQDIVKTTSWVFNATNLPCEQAALAYWTIWNTELKKSPRKQWLSDRLAEEMNRNQRFACNYAIALGVLKDNRCIPVLLDILRNPGGPCDPVIPGAYPNRIKAILLLGRFRVKDALPLLLNIVRDNAESFMKDLYGPASVAAHDTQAFSTPEMCRFQALSFTLNAIRSILDDIPTPEISNELHEWQQNAPALMWSNGKNLTDFLKLIQFK